MDMNRKFKLKKKQNKSISFKLSEPLLLSFCEIQRKQENNPSALTHNTVAHFSVAPGIADGDCMHYAGIVRND